MAMAIFLNGKKEDIEKGMSVSKLLVVKNIRPEVVTVELNDRIIKKEEYNEALLKEKDRLEFVYYMGGGLSTILKETSEKPYSYTDGHRFLTDRHR